MKRQTRYPALNKAESGFQLPHEVVDVASWQPLPLTELVVPGSHDYQLLECPPSERRRFLVPHQPYHFKFSKRQSSPEQFWNEIVAFRLGTYLGVPVPQTHVAVNSLTGQVGALSQWFYDYRSESFQTSREMMRGLISKYGESDGVGFNFVEVAEWLDFLNMHRIIVDNWRNHWAKVFLLDGLMGNTDRHQDNWGVVWSATPEGRQFIKLAPAYDNSTSLGYEFPSARLGDLRSDIRLLKYISRGRNCMLWRVIDRDRLSHPEFLARYLAQYSDQRSGVIERLRITDESIVRLVMNLMRFQVPVPLSQARAQLMIRLLLLRRDYLTEFLSD